MNADLRLGDCLDVLPTLGHVDAVVTDPPYGIGYSKDSEATAGYRPDGSRVWGKVAKPIIGDDKPFDPAPFLSIGKTHVFWGANAYAGRLPSRYGWIVWDKQIVGKWSGGDADMAWTDFLGSNRIHRQRWQGIQRAGAECPFVGGGLVHPTQKPVDLMMFCIEKATKPGDTVLDPFMGSGTTGVACMKLGRNFIGIERDPGYFAIAQRRIADAQAQMVMPLFQPVTP